MRFLHLNFLIFFLLFIVSLNGQKIDATVHVDDQGIMRWTEDESEIRGFGVNYTVPFAHAYRSAIKMGIDPYRAIDQDIYQFKRLGFDLYRVHVWDTEISDSLGNLINNEHLQVFDYLLWKLAENDIKYILTPIAFWGNGWPDKGEDTPGFSNKYGKRDCLTDPDAIKAQENYLYQFMNHKNPYTNASYKVDTNLIAIEISNEPHHREEASAVTEFVKKMVKAVRKSGFANPVFYNTSHSVHLMPNYFEGGIDGGTFQWYPTGLGYQRELPGNFLPNVDQYNIPHKEIFEKNKGAKIVYEFDGADVNKSYIYPAIARSFREACIQLATHFSYDPSFLGPYNTEYNTHYMNLLYTPHKAIGLMIASEVFHQVKMGSDFGNYPFNKHFKNFFVDAESDLALLNQKDKFYYSNSTNNKPIDPAKLKHIAGHGNSVLVNYVGKGAYFLDKMEEGVWMLEVFPDVFHIRNPFGQNNQNKHLSILQYNQQKMTVDLLDLGSNFSIHSIKENQFFQGKAKDGKFEIQPGKYLLAPTSSNPNVKPYIKYAKLLKQDFIAPIVKVDSTFINNKTIRRSINGVAVPVKVELYSPDKIEAVKVMYLTFKGFEVANMNKSGAFSYSAQIPADVVGDFEGFILPYYIIVETDKGMKKFPSGKDGHLLDQKIMDRIPYQVEILPKKSELKLFEAKKHRFSLRYSYWPDEFDLLSTPKKDEFEWRIGIKSLYKKDPENLDAELIPDYTIRHFLDEENIVDLLKEGDCLQIKVRSLKAEKMTIQVAVVDKDGVSFGKTIVIDKNIREYVIPLEDLEIVKTVTMPRPYPTFLPYYFIHKMKHQLKTENIRGIQLSIGPSMTENELKNEHGIGLICIKLK